MIFRYLSILVALAVTLGGIQVPGFIEQYEQRVHAHLIEVQTNLAGFEQIADRYHGGSIEALIEHHHRSIDPTFREEGDVIEAMVIRRAAFLRQLEGLEATLAGRVRHMLFDANPELLANTAQRYTPTITLNRETLFSGVIALVLGLAITELFHLIGLGIRHRRRRPST